MCGIVGLVTNSQFGGITKEMQAFSDMLYMDALRGFDSTGVAIYQNDGGLRITKEATDAAAFIGTKEFDEIFKDYVKCGKAVIGHNRKKTIGAVKDETAHPFLIDNRYAFVHNGTLYNHEKLAKTEVDSEALAQHITPLEGDIESLGQSLGDVYGAYACAWIDAKKEKLYLLRNKERTLFYAKFEGGWLFCSEPGFLKLSFIRHGMKVEDPLPVPEHTLITFDLAIANPTPTLEKIEVKKYTASSTVSQPAGLTVGTNIGVSKNAYKKISKQNVLVGKRHTFYMDDYVSKVVNDKKPTKWIIFGKSFRLPFPHKFVVDLNGPTEEEMIDFYPDVIFDTEITSMTYDPKEKLVVLRGGTPTFRLPKDKHEENPTALH